MPFSGVCEVSLPTRPTRWQPDLERHYQNVLFIVFKLVGFYTETEYRTAEGRVDLVVKTSDYIYVMDLN